MKKSCTKEYVSPLVRPLALENLNENEMKRKRIDGLYVPQDFGFPKSNEDQKIQKEARK